MSNIYKIEMACLNDPNHLSIDVYFSGCDIEPKCKNCHNPLLWDKSVGKKFDNEELFLKIFILAEKTKKLNICSDYLSVCYLGGEPLAEYNRDTLKYVSGRVKETLKIRQVIFTGRTLEEINLEDLSSYISHCTFLKYGRYEENNKVFGEYLSSGNQRLIELGLGDKFEH